MHTVGNLETLVILAPFSKGEMGAYRVTSCFGNQNVQKKVSCSFFSKRQQRCTA